MCYMILGGKYAMAKLRAEAHRLMSCRANVPRFVRTFAPPRPRTPKNGHSWHQCPFQVLMGGMGRWVAYRLCWLNCAPMALCTIDTQTRVIWLGAFRERVCWWEVVLLVISAFAGETQIAGQTRIAGTKSQVTEFCISFFFRGL